MIKFIIPAILASTSYTLASDLFGSLFGHRPMVSGLAILVGIAVFGIFFRLWLSVETSVPDGIVLPPDTKQEPILPRRALPVILIVSGSVALIKWSVTGFIVNRTVVLSAIEAGAGSFLLLAIYWLKGRTARSYARRLLEASLAVEEADRMHRRALLNCKQGAIAAAIVEFREVLSIQRRYRPTAHAAVLVALADLSDTYLSAKRFAETVALAKELQQLLANKRHQSTPHLTRMITANNERRLGTAYMGLKEYVAAAEHLAVAVVIWDGLLREDDRSVSDLIEKELGYSELPIFDASNHYALICALMGNAAEAIKYDEQLIAFNISFIASRGLDQDTLLAMAGEARLEGDVTRGYLESLPIRAVTLQQKTLAFETVARGVAPAFQHLGLGLAWEDCGGLAVARHHYELGLERARIETGEQSEDYRRALRSLGRLALAEEDYSGSARFYEQALAVSRAGTSDQSTGFDCSQLAKAMLELGNVARARNLAREALKLNSVEIVRADAYSTLSEVLAREGSSDAAILLGKCAANLALSRVEGGSGRVFEARLRDESAPVVRRLAGYLVDVGRLAEAQQVLDQLKEREYDEFVTRGGNEAVVRAEPRVGGAPSEAGWIRHGDDLEEAISALSSERQSLLNKSERSAAENKRLDALHDLLDRAKQDLDDWLDGLVDMLRAERPTAHEQVRALNLDLLETLRGDLAELGPQVALVHFILGTRRLAIILTRPDLQISREVEISNVEIHRLLHRFRREIRLHRGDRVTLQNLSRELYKILIAPIAEYLRDVETLMVVLDGALRYLPLSALYDGNKYLIEQCGIAILTSASHTRLKDRPVDWIAGGVGGLGVSRASDGTAPLTAVGDELRAIIREGQETEGIYPGKRYLDGAFTTAALVDALHAHKAIHIASHFEFAAANDAASMLLLGDGEELSLRELRADRFAFRNVELVTLSACETALGTEPSEAAALQGLRRMNGVEFESLGETIQKRGAKAVIATLWAVEDNSTAIFMRQFYRARRDGQTKAAALRSAQLTLLRGEEVENYTHPYFWAPFVLMGNWQ
jgi:CHAT domain-containing protein